MGAALEALARAVPGDALFTDAATRLAYGYDNSRHRSIPGAVVRPAGTAEVAATVGVCAAHRMPLTARGMGTATTGAAVPRTDGIVVSFERMAAILEVNPEDRLMVVQPGVLNTDVQHAAAEHGLFWAPDPTSAPYSTIGGNLACNAAGPRAVKYGTTRENVLGLEAVTGTGEVIRTGSRTTKGVVGYDLTRLLVGSEGTLALITEAVLRLTPEQPARGTLRAVFRDTVSAARAVAAVMSGPVTPCAVEFMDRTAIDMVRTLGGEALPPDAGALLLIEVDGMAERLPEDIDMIAARVSGAGPVELDRATSTADIEALWTCRRALSPAQRKLKPHKINEDVVVPVSMLPRLVEGVETLAARHDVLAVCFGHAGNGNLHVNLLGDDADLPRRTACLDGLFRLVLELGGTISGEHGIGSEKRRFVDMELDAPSLALMRAVKAAFDPHGILNPGKVLPDE